MAWSLWLAIALEVPIPVSELNAVTLMDDPLIPLLVLFAEERGLIMEGCVDKTHWVELARNEGLDSSNWLLAYEGALRGWLPPDTARKVDEHTIFGWLRENTVSFFDGDASVTALKRWTGMLGYGDPANTERQTESPPF